MSISQLKPAVVLKGIATYVPGVKRLACRYSGGTVSARYCYSVWLRHFIKAWENGLETRFNCVAELGPGDSFGIGLSAMLSGVDSYYAFDAKPYAYAPKNLEIFDELIDLFLKREPIPDETEFPKLSPYLSNYSFPHELLTEEYLRNSLREERLNSIRRAIKAETMADNQVRIIYVAPWDDTSLIEPGTVDFVFSQAVMEHVEDIEFAYEALYRWLKPGGLMSHKIDFKCHGLTKDWNGHWSISELLWKIIKGKRPYLINRLPHSAHITAVKKAGFQIVTDLMTESEPILRETLASPFQSLSDDDLGVSGAFVQAAKPL